MSFHPVHFGSVGIPMWQLVSSIRSHACGVSGGTLTRLCMCVCVRAHRCTSTGLVFTVNHLLFFFFFWHMSDSHTHTQWFQSRGASPWWSISLWVTPTKKPILNDANATYKSAGTKGRRVVSKISILDHQTEKENYHIVGFFFNYILFKFHLKKKHSYYVTRTLMEAGCSG